MFGEERVMYGSNWPVSNKVAPYAEVLKTMQRYTTSEKYFWRNSKECYRWVARG
jgi:L-fuconolactonase